MVHTAVREAMTPLADELRRGRSAAPEDFSPGWDMDLGHGAAPELSLDDAANPSRAGALSGARGPVTASIRQRILSNKYIDLKTLLLPSERPSGGDERQYLVAEGGRIALGSAAQKEELSVMGWTKAFLRYANVYTEGFPDSAGDLLKYMSTVLDLTAKGLGDAWREYDESFRKAREVSPNDYLWDRPPHMLWMGAVATGIAAFQGETRGGGPEGFSFQPRRSFFPSSSANRAGTRGAMRCLAFNSRRGCFWRDCRFRHACSRCEGAHSLRQCPALPAQEEPQAVIGPPRQENMQWGGPTQGSQLR